VFSAFATAVRTVFATIPASAWREFEYVQRLFDTFAANLNRPLIELFSARFRTNFVIARASIFSLLAKNLSDGINLSFEKRSLPYVLPPALLQRRSWRRRDWCNPSFL